MTSNPLSSVTSVTRIRGIGERPWANELSRLHGGTDGRGPGRVTLLLSVLAGLVVIVGVVIATVVIVLFALA